MIANISRVGSFLSCRRRNYYSNELRLKPFTTDYNLIFGGAVHTGAEAFNSGKTLSEALNAAEEKIRVRYKAQSSFLLPEELPLIDKYARQSRSATEAFIVFFKQFSDFKVVRPEVRFCVPLPNSVHHCKAAHRLLFPDVPYHFCAAKENVVLPCNIPHYIAGRTDGIALWRKMLWFLEIKTTGDLKESFFRKFILDLQTTAYTYGIKKEAQIEVHGFVLVKITKPNKKAKDQFHYTVDAEPITKTPEDLRTFEVEMVQILNDYEDSLPVDIVTDHSQLAKVYRNPASCFDYNRECMFHSVCKNNRLPEEGEFKVERKEDYVDLYLKYKLGLLTKEEFDQKEKVWREEFR